MNDQFYVTLPSNVRPENEFIYNIVSNYSTKLSQKLNFPADEKWCAGLAQISYTKSWYNVSRDCEMVLYNDIGEEINVTVEKSYLKIPAGHYESVEELILYINERFKLIGKHVLQTPILDLDYITKKVKLSAGVLNTPISAYESAIDPDISNNKHNTYFFVYFGEEIENILGLVSKDGSALYRLACDNLRGCNHKYFVNSFYNKIQTGSYPADLNQNYRTLYLYCDKVQHSFIGDSFSQLLSEIEIPNNTKFGDQIVIRFDTPHMIPIITNSFDTIEIDLKDELNNSIEFQSGRLIIKLVFKKW